MIVEIGGLIEDEDGLKAVVENGDPVRLNYLPRPDLVGEGDRLNLSTDPPTYLPPRPEAPEEDVEDFLNGNLRSKIYRPGMVYGLSLQTQVRLMTQVVVENGMASFHPWKIFHKIAERPSKYYGTLDNSPYEIERFCGLVDTKTSLPETPSREIIQAVSDRLKDRVMIELETSAKNISPIRGISYLPESIKRIVSRNVSCITGGPGTGKSTLVYELVKNIEETLKVPITVTSFTGKAINRVSEIFERKGYTPRYKPFTVDMLIASTKRRQIRILIIDEASMLSYYTFYRFILKYPLNRYAVIFVGDVDQLPPVEGDYFFRDLLEQKFVYKTVLNTNHRTECLDIVENAGKIIRGEPPVNTANFKLVSGTVDDVVLYERPGTVYLSWRNRDVKRINELVMKRLEITPFDVGCRVMVTSNDYGSGVFNGEVGHVTGKPRNGTRTVEIEGRSVEVKLKNLTVAYALTVHKSQGSEYEHVVVYLHSPKNVNKRLYYTAVTRARYSVTVVTCDL